MSFNTDFRPFSGDLLLLSPAMQVSRRHRIILLIPFATFALLASLQIALFDHPLVPLLNYVCSDFRAVVALNPSSAPRCHSITSSFFPLRRDFLTLFAGSVLTLTPLLTWKMWDGYATLISHMVGRGSIKINPNGVDKFKQQIQSANEDVARIGRFGGVTILLMAIIMNQFLVQQSRDGVFNLFGPQATQTSWSKEAYSHWWASSSQPFGHMVYFAVGTWGLYLLTQQNLVGCRLILLLWRSRNMMTFGADPINSDGYFGWAKVRQSLSAVYAMLALHGLALTCIIRMMPTQIIIGPVAVAWLQWVIVVPLYVGFPFFFVRGRIASYKRAELTRLEASAASLDPGLPEHERLAAEGAIGARIAVIRGVPTLPFKSLRDTSIFVISLVADITAVLGILASYLK